MGTRVSEAIVVEALAIGCSDVHAIVCVLSVSASISSLTVSVAGGAIQDIRVRDRALIAEPLRGVR